jgi:hypothetical protein
MPLYLLRPALFFCLLSVSNSLFGHSGGFFQIQNKRPVTDFNQLASTSLTLLTHKEDSAFISAFDKDADQPSERIVGGSDASIEDYPWQVALLLSNGNQYCAGSILSEQWILTAAHCGMPSKIRAGVTNRNDTTGQERTVLQRIVHPLYTPFKNDVALLLLNAHLDFSDPKVQAISIATQLHAEEGYTDAGVKTVVTGWGATLYGGESSDILQFAEIPLVSNEDAVFFGGYNPSQITDDMLCAGFMGVGGVDACQGDSGGPLIVPDPENDQGFVLAGVTSWGIECARPEYPGVWARVSYFENWIQGHTGLSWDGPSGLPNLSDFSADALSCDQVFLSWNQNILNNDVVLTLSVDGTFGIPANGTNYSIGDTIPGGGAVLYSGSNTSYLHTGLEPGKVYFYKAWAVNNQFDYSIGRFARDTTNCLKFTLPFVETFEDDSESRNCWSQMRDGSSHSWIFASGSNGGNVKTAIEGQKNARFTSSGGGPHITKLVSPVFNLFFFEDVELSFWYAQQEWAGDQNELIIYYRTEESAPWVQIGSVYSSNITAWTQVEGITLPDPSANYQIAFEGIDNWGYANVIDQISVTGTYTGPPDFVSLQDIVIDNSSNCFAAIEYISVAGSGSYFHVESAGEVTLTAGFGISFLEGTWIKSGSNLLAYIDSTGMFCNNHNMLASKPEEVQNYSEDSANMIIKKSDSLSRDLSTIRIFPNPTAGLISVKLSNIPMEDEIFVDFYNLQGVLLLRYEQIASSLFTFDVSQFLPGMYILRIVSSNANVSARFLKY